MTTAKVNQIARKLRVDPENLSRFAENHPNPDIGVIARMAEVDPETLSPDLREQIEDWLASVGRQSPLSESQQERVDAALEQYQDRREAVLDG